MANGGMAGTWTTIQLLLGGDFRNGDAQSVSSDAYAVAEFDLWCSFVCGGEGVQEGVLFCL